jgi:adenylyltransferase/sulfurtransferase
VVGCGALGSALAEAVVRAGVGQLCVVDRDVVEVSNLHRQSLFEEEDAERARPKAVAAEARLRRMNSDVAVDGMIADVNPTNAAALVRETSLVLDGTDNFETRYLMNDVCLEAGVPWVYGACVAAHGTVLAVRPGRTPCLRCVLGERPAAGSTETCDTAGAIGPAVQVVAGIQAAEALKLIVGAEEALLAGLVAVDVWEGTFDVVEMRGREPWCPSCVERRFDYASSTAQVSSVLCGHDAVQLRPGAAVTLDLRTLADRLAVAGEVVTNDHLVRFRCSDAELIVFSDGRAIVKGVSDAPSARSVYARYVGV